MIIFFPSTLCLASHSASLYLWRFFEGGGGYHAHCVAPLAWVVVVVAVSSSFPVHRLRSWRDPGNFFKSSSAPIAEANVVVAANVAMLYQEFKTTIKKTTGMRRLAHGSNSRKNEPVGRLNWIIKGLPTAHQGSNQECSRFLQVVSRWFLQNVDCGQKILPQTSDEKECVL